MEYDLLLLPGRLCCKHADTQSYSCWCFSIRYGSPGEFLKVSSNKQFSGQFRTVDTSFLANRMAHVGARSGGRCLLSALSFKIIINSEQAITYTSAHSQPDLQSAALITIHSPPYAPAATNNIVFFHCRRVDIIHRWYLQRMLL